MCNQKNSLKCNNCTYNKEKYKLKIDTAHAAFDRGKCDTYKHLVRRRIQQTDYHTYNPLQLGISLVVRSAVKVNN